MNNLNHSVDRRNKVNPLSPRNSSVKLTKSTASKFDDSSILQQSHIQQQSDNLRVVIRIRPPLPREIEEGLPFRSIVIYILY